MSFEQIQYYENLILNIFSLIQYLKNGVYSPILKTEYRLMNITLS